MAKTKEFKLPKYLKLNKGVMWFDIHGDNPSGVKLYAVNKELVGRGIKRENSQAEFDMIARRQQLLDSGKIREYNEFDSFVDVAEPSADADIDNRARKGEYGWIECEDKSVFCTKDIDNDKLANIITAFKSGVLVAYDEKKKEAKVKSEIRNQQKKDFGFTEKGDIVFIGTNKAMFQKVNNLSPEKLILFIDRCGPSASNNLMDLYHYEKKGYNPISRPRSEILDAIQKKLNEFGPSMSPISINEFDDQDTKTN